MLVSPMRYRDMSASRSARPQLLHFSHFMIADMHRRLPTISRSYMPHKESTFGVARYFAERDIADTPQSFL